MKKLNDKEFNAKIKKIGAKTTIYEHVQSKIDLTSRQLDEAIKIKNKKETRQ